MGEARSAPGLAVGWGAELSSGSATSLILISSLTLLWHGVISVDLEGSRIPYNN